MKQEEIDALASRVESGGKLTRAEAIELLDACDHAILDCRWARAVSEPFGYEPRLTSIQDQRSEFKGAHFPDLKEGKYAHEVIGADALAEQICRSLGVEYPGMYGRGSQLHACCAALRRYEIILGKR